MEDSYFYPLRSPSSKCQSVQVSLCVPTNTGRRLRHSWNGSPISQKHYSRGDGVIKVGLNAIYDRGSWVVTRRGYEINSDPRCLFSICRLMSSLTPLSVVHLVETVRMYSTLRLDTFELVVG